MTHEEYLSQLIRGFAGDWSVPQPSYSGSSETDAVARWLAYNVAHHAVANCRFDPNSSNRIVAPVVQRVWKRWETDREEDIDMQLIGVRGRAGVIHSIKVVVRPVDPSRYVLRLSDYTMGRSSFAVDGARRDQAGGRVLLDDSSNPRAWAIQRQHRSAHFARRPPTLRRLRLPPCCGQALRNIDGTLECFRLAGAIMVVAPFADFFTPANPRSRAAAVADDAVDALELARADWDGIAGAVRGLNEIGRQRAIGIITLERAHHVGPLEQFWARMEQSFRRR